MTSPLQTLLMKLHEVAPERMARAKQMGFDTNKIYLHGTNSGNVDKFDRSLQGSMNPTEDWQSPLHDYFYFTDDPALASEYSFAHHPYEYRQSNVIPVFLKNDDRENIYKFDGKGEGFHQQKVKRRLQRRDLPPVHQIHGINTEDVSAREFIDEQPELQPSTTVAMMDPSHIRSIFANFDPAKERDHGLLASLGPPAAAGLTAATALSPDTSQASTPERISGYILDDVRNQSNSAMQQLMSGVHNHSATDVGLGGLSMLGIPEMALLRPFIDEASAGNLQDQTQLGKLGNYAR